MYQQKSHAIYYVLYCYVTGQRRAFRFASFVDALNFAVCFEPWFIVKCYSRGFNYFPLSIVARSAYVS